MVQTSILLHQLLVALPAVALCGMLQPAQAQCANQWNVGRVPGVHGRVHATAVWDPDGPGPLGNRIVFGGEFVTAGDINAQFIVSYDPVTRAWAPFGSGMDYWVSSLLPLPNGDLLAGGYFSAAGGVAASRLALWTGNAWRPFGPGLRYLSQPSLLWDVADLARLPNGDIVACGRFEEAGSVSTQGVARWDGTAWHALGGGLQGTLEQPVLPNALALLGNGDIVVAGGFLGAGTQSTRNIARWDGTAWQAFGAGADGFVSALEVLPNGDLVAAGDFRNIGGVPALRVAAWDRTTWRQLGAGLQASVFDLTLDPSGELFAGGFDQFFPNAGPYCAARYSGSSWQPLGSNPGWHRVWSLAKLPGGDLFIGGDFYAYAGPPFASCVARWNGSSWSPLAAGTAGTVRAFSSRADGNVIAGGSFRVVDGVPAEQIARWDRSAWQPLGSGVNGSVFAVLSLANGDIIAGGEFGSAGGVPVSNIARWNGVSWSPLGTGVNGRVTTLAELADGRVLVGGFFTVAGATSANAIALWDGTGWQRLGSGLASPVYCVAQGPNGQLIAGHGGGISHWNGATWTVFGAATSTFPAAVFACHHLPDGNLVAVGSFQRMNGLSVNGAARFDGTSWQTMGAGPGLSFVASGLAVLPDGQVVVGQHNRLMRYDGITWTPLDRQPDSGVYALVWARDQLFVGGDFTNLNGSPTPYLARLTSTCPAGVTRVETPCIGPAGPLGLTADTFPWVGGVFRSRARSYAANAVGVALYGPSSPGVPLSQLHPLGLVGCDLLSSLAILVPVSVVGGEGGSLLPIPRLTALAGVPLFHQQLQLAVNGQGALASISSSNALRLVFGVF